MLEGICLCTGVQVCIKYQYEILTGEITVVAKPEVFYVTLKTAFTCVKPNFFSLCISAILCM